MTVDIYRQVHHKRGAHRKTKKAMQKHLEDFRNSDDPPTRKGGF